MVHFRMNWSGLTVMWNDWWGSLVGYGQKQKRNYVANRASCMHELDHNGRGGGHERRWIICGEVQRFMPMTTEGPDTLLHGEDARGPYRNSMPGRCGCCPWGADCCCLWLSRAFHAVRMRLDLSSSWNRGKVNFTQRG